jgi:hypothetical protein
MVILHNITLQNRQTTKYNTAQHYPAIKTYIIRGVDVFQDIRQIGEWFNIFTRQVRKQLAKNIERVSKREKNPHQTGEWVCIVTR